MSMELDKIYQRRILEEAKNSFHFEKYEDAQYSDRAYNPICGDQFDLYFDMTENKISEVHFHGFGCTISKASTSLMLREITGMSKNDAIEFIKDFLQSIDDNTDIKAPSLKVFEKTENFKGRLDCIVLSWKALKNSLEKI